MNAARRSITAAAGVLLAVAALTSCGPGDTDPDPTSGPTSATTDEATPTPTPSVTPDPTPAPEALTCQNIVPQSRLDFITSQGWTLWEPGEFFTKLRGEGFGYAVLRFQDNGGIVCPWLSGSHVAYVYGYSPLPEDQVASASADVLDDDPYVQSDFAGGVLFTGQMDESPYRLYWIDLRGSWYLASAEDLLDELRRQNP